MFKAQPGGIKPGRKENIMEGLMISLPCKIGDRVYAIRNYKGVKHAQEGIVAEMFFTLEMKLHIVVKHVARGEWGKTVFATHEEAEAALAERKTSCKNTM